MGGMLGMLPGVGKIKKQLADANIDESIIKRQEAIISSMTKSERRNPKLLNGSRRRRIAAGSGTSVPEINRLLKQYQDMADMMKKMKKLGKKGLMRHGLAGADAAAASALSPIKRLDATETGQPTRMSRWTCP